MKQTNKIKTLNNSNNKNPHRIKQNSRDDENIFEKDSLLEAALTVLPSVLVLDDLAWIGMNLP